MAKKRSIVTRGFIITVGSLIFVIVAVFFFVPLQTQDVQCITAPCPPIQKTLYDLILESSQEEPFACIEIFQPVCGSDGITYSNSCFALGSGVEVIHQGMCTEQDIPEPVTTFCRIYPNDQSCQ